MNIKIIIKRPYFKREKPKKGKKHQRTEKHDFKGVITNVNHQICYVRIVETVNERKDIEAQQEIRAPYDCVIKQNNFFYYYFNIFNNLYKNYILLGRYLGYMTQHFVFKDSKNKNSNEISKLVNEIKRIQSAKQSSTK